MLFWNRTNQQKCSIEKRGLINSQEEEEEIVLNK